jgi:large-conductance mechanosensitive channel
MLITVMALVIMLQAHMLIKIIIGIATMSILTAIVDAICENVLGTLTTHFHFLALLLGRTLGNFVPFSGVARKSVYMRQ